jgi:hypothetical protein
MLPQEAHKDVWLLKDIGSSQALLGCSSCLDSHMCGGLHLVNGRSVLSCMDLCRCDDPAKCDLVCPKAPARYARRLMEIRGFELDGIPHHRPMATPRLPGCIPVLEGRIAQRRPVELDYAAIPLSRAIKGRGDLKRARTRDELARDHGVSPSKGWVVTGIEDDRFVESTWRLPRHREIFRGMRDAGVVFATSPNFSLYADSPRHDNLHAMKRIAWMWHLMNEAGLPTALHVNGRTDFDFERWAGFILKYPEVTSISFEFLTGAKVNEDADRYFERLVELRRRVNRPLTLVLRGSMEIAKRLEAEYDSVIWLDATPYFRAKHRHEAVFRADGTLTYSLRRGDAAAPIGGLFKELAAAAQRRFRSHPSNGKLALQRVLDLRAPSAPPDVRADDTASQIGLFSQSAST